jgi:hypothetical protein
MDDDANSIPDFNPMITNYSNDPDPVGDDGEGIPDFEKRICQHQRRHKYVRLL